MRDVRTHEDVGMMYGTENLISPASFFNPRPSAINMSGAPSLEIPLLRLALTGTPGTGKTRLSEELRSSVEITDLSVLAEAKGFLAQDEEKQAQEDDGDNAREERVLLVQAVLWPSNQGRDGHRQGDERRVVQ